MFYAVIALLVGGLLGGGGYFYNRKQDIATNPFADAMDQMDSATEQNMGGADKALPSLEGAEPQQWEENETIEYDVDEYRLDRFENAFVKGAVAAGWIEN